MKNLGVFAAMKFGQNKKKRQEEAHELEISNAAYEALCYDITKRVQENHEREDEWNR